MYGLKSLALICEMSVRDQGNGLFPNEGRPRLGSLLEVAR